MKAFWAETSRYNLFLCYHSTEAHFLCIPLRSNEPLWHCKHVLLTILPRHLLLLSLSWVNVWMYRPQAGDYTDSHSIFQRYCRDSWLCTVVQMGTCASFWAWYCSFCTECFGHEGLHHLNNSLTVIQPTEAFVTETFWTKTTVATLPHSNAGTRTHWYRYMCTYIRVLQNGCREWHSTHDSPVNFDLTLGTIRRTKRGFKVQSWVASWMPFATTTLHRRVPVMGHTI